MSLSIGKETKLLARHSVVYGIGNISNRAAAFLLLPIYTQYLTPNDYGVKELVGLSTEVIAILLSTAISSAVYRFYYEQDGPTERNEVLSSALVGVGVIGLVAIAILSGFTTTMARYILDDADLNYFFMISFCSMWFQSLNEIGNNYLRLERRSVRYVVLSSSKLLLAISLNIYFVVFRGMGVLGVLVSTLIASVALSSVLVIPVLRKVGLRVSLPKLRAMLRFGLPLIPSQLGAFVVHLSGRFFIKGYCSIADAGLYSLGYRFGTLPSNFISSPFNQVWLPRRFELYKREGSEELFGRIFTYFLCFLVPAGLAVSVLTEDLLRIMAAPTFWSAWRIVPIIALADVIFSLHYHLNMGILIEKKTRYLAYVNLSNGALVILLNLLLIPRYGIYGAAVTTLIAFVCKVSLTYYFSSRYYRIHFEFGRIGLLLLSAAIVYAMCTQVELASLYWSLLAKAGVVCSYPVLLLLLGFFSVAEKERIAAVVRRLVGGS